MAHNDNDIQKLERALTETHRARQASLLGATWAQSVMRDISQRAAQERHRNIGPGAERLVWRTAAIAATVAVVLTIAIAAVSWTSSGESAGLLAEEFEFAPMFSE